MNNCSAFGCAVGSCFLKYWGVNKTIIASATLLMSIMLLSKLISLKCSHEHRARDLTRVNQLCLVDTLTVFIVDLSPYFFTLVFGDQVIHLDGYGPYNAVLKIMACFVDAIIATFVIGKVIKPRQMSVIGTPYVITTGVGIIAGILQTIFNFKIIQDFILKSNMRNQVEFQLIFMRPVLDVVNGFINTIYYSLTIPSITHPEYLRYDYIFAMVLLGSNILESRSFLAAGIAIERTIATYFPINFYKYRGYVSNIPIITFFLALGALGDVVLFKFCNFSFPINPDCTTFICATTQCYQNYSSITKIIYCSINLIFSVLLCFKLLTMTCNKTTSSADLKKANLLSITDGVSSVIFEFLPSLMFNYSAIDITPLGPITGVLRTISRAVEATVMYSLMTNHHKVVNPSVSISSRREILF
ncbi:unnamed protein product [Caenorhabditis angaria]|uniref:Serpentine Receptor, class BC (Class B-like) n=1 Tax=Caenorhabditis angaria TaxID=860376 RepID=A0A9P1N7R1_9PELO|nr:unnamed protein product [Caenorhabditis angaria]